jgi:hypothetical protein
MAVHRATPAETMGDSVHAYPALAPEAGADDAGAAGSSRESFNGGSLRRPLTYPHRNLKA